MGKDSSSWLHKQHSPRQLPDLNCTSPMPELGQQNIVEGCTYPHTCVLSASSSSLPGLAIPESPYLKAADQANDLNGWFYCLPRHRQALIPSPNAFTKEMLSALPCGCGGKSLPNSVSGAVQNRFLVFDQSGNQTSLYFGPPVQHAPLSKKPKLFDTYGSCRQERTSKFELDHMNVESRHVISDGLDENQETGEESEMHEDTEELDALLYSDGDSDYDDEETSTGHYPGESTEHEAQEVPEGSAEDVASSMGTTERKRQLDEKQSIVDTASSSKPNVVSWDYQDDADSSCVKGSKRTRGEEMDSLPSNKRLKKEKIREAVSILQSIIPGGKGKDAMFVLDEAIRYLRSMKAQS